MSPVANAALSELAEEAAHVTLWDARVIPGSDDLIADALRHTHVMTIEDGVRHGGAGEFILDQIRRRAGETGAKMPTSQVLGVPREYLQHHSPDQLLAEIGLDREGIAESLRRALAHQPPVSTTLPIAPRPLYF
jgi:1-deoxy-D-xylulose-5-phosphate synthase